jgi:hypothetical protein
VAAQLTAFYEATTAICFALLGFWWVVVQLRHESFTTDRRMRVIGYHVSMSFVLPGVMSLTALLAVDNPILWRSGFAVASVIGVAHTVYVIAQGDNRNLGRWITAILYLLIGAIAIRPKLPNDLGFDVSPLAVEGTLVAVFILVGVNVAWSYLTRPH